MIHPSLPYVTTDQTSALTRRTFVERVTCLLFHILDSDCITDSRRLYETPGYEKVMVRNVWTLEVVTRDVMRIAYPAAMRIGIECGVFQTDMSCACVLMYIASQ